MGKGAAAKAWEKAQPPLDDCLKTLAWQTRSEGWTKDNGQFIPHPATWLNQSRWTDEPETGTEKAARGNPQAKYNSVFHTCLSNFQDVHAKFNGDAEMLQAVKDELKAKHKGNLQAVKDAWDEFKRVLTKKGSEG